MQVLFEIMVQNKQKGGTGVKSPPPRSFSGGTCIEDTERGYEFMYFFPLSLVPQKMQ